MYSYTWDCIHGRSVSRAGMMAAGILHVRNTQLNTNAPAKPNAAIIRSERFRIKLRLCAGFLGYRIHGNILLYRHTYWVGIYATIALSCFPGKHRIRHTHSSCNFPDTKFFFFVIGTFTQLRNIGFLEVRSTRVGSLDL